MAQHSRQKPANLFAFNAHGFHPVYATTFILDFFHYVIIDGRTFDSVAGLILNSSALARHSAIVRFWTYDSVVRNCTIKWAHARTQPWGEPVPYQCPTCHCIQSWDQKANGASSELDGGGVTMRCRGNQASGRCSHQLKFSKPGVPFKKIKEPEGVWVALGIGKGDFL